MKQKQVKSSPKPAKQTKNVKTPQKNVPVVAEESDDEETEVVQEKVVAKKAVAKKPVNKKVAKAKQVVVEPEPEEDEEDDDQEEVENAAEEDDEQSDAEMDDDDEQEADDDEQEAVDDDDEDDEAAEEATKEEPTIPSKVKSGPISTHTIPLKKIIHISKLPKRCRQTDILQAFWKYGQITQTYILTTSSGTTADVAFKKAMSAVAAIADDNKVKVGDCVVSIAKKESIGGNKKLVRERSVTVTNIIIGTTEAQLMEHFKACGEVEQARIQMSRSGVPSYAVVTFANKTTVPIALKMHNSILNDSNIKVKLTDERREVHQYEETLTVMLRNKQQLKSVDVAKLESIFSKCGEIDYVDIICRRQILAFITFKNKEAAEKAIELSGKTLEEIELEVEPFSRMKKLTSIHIVNLHKDVTEEDLKNHFSNAGEIANIILKNKYAIIRFADSDGFCKSFLYNESFLKGQMLFVEPHSIRKAKVMELSKRKLYKRAIENGRGGFHAKKSKKN